MATAQTRSVAPAASTPPSKVQSSWSRANWGLLLAIAALIVIALLPTPDGLPVAGQRMLALLAFAVIVWMTEALDYAVSAVVIAALIALLLGFSPNVANPNVLYGTSAGLTTAFSGFANTALALVAAALFLSAAMTATGLDKRKSAFAGMLMITTVQTASISYAQTPATVARGKDIAERVCAGCHAIDGRQGGTVMGADVPSFRALADRPYRTPESLQAYIMTPRHPMPAIPLELSEIRDVVDYIQSLK
jgi:mono/diheme cytochrome c family protein